MASRGRTGRDRYEGGGGDDELLIEYTMRDDCGIGFDHDPEDYKPWMTNPWLLGDQ